MKTTHLTHYTDFHFYHDSETVNHVINKLVAYYKPNTMEPLAITEIQDLYDYGNQYVFLLHFHHGTENEDIHEEISTLIPEIEDLSKTSDFAITMQCDISHNDHFTLLTLTK